MRRMTVSPRHVGVRALVLLALVAWGIFPTGVYDTSRAAFSGSSGNPPNSFTADTLDPTGSFSASRPCTPLSPGLRDATTNSTIMGSSLALTTPATAVGDYLILSLTFYNNGGAAFPTVTTPTGWTALGTNTALGAGYDVMLAVFARPAPASPAASYTVSYSTMFPTVGTLASYSGISNMELWTGNTGTTATAVAPSLTAAAANRLLLAFVAHSGTTSSTPAGMTAGPAINGSGAGMHQFHEVRGSGATGTRSSSINATSPAWATLTLLLIGSATGYDPTVNLSWTATPDTWASGYEIIRAGGPTTAVSGRTTVAWSDTTTSSATGYSYTISAAGGNWRSTTRSVTVNAC